MWVNITIIFSSLFKIEVQMTSKCIRFGSDFTRPKPDNQIKSTKVLGPTSLSLGEHFCSQKILQIFMVSNDINRKSRTFEIMMPCIESFINCKKLLVMNIIVKLGQGESPGKESNWMKFTIRFLKRENHCQSIIRCIGLNNNWTVSHQWVRTGTDINTCLRVRKASWQLSLKSQGTFFWVNRVSGTTMLE